MLPAADARDPFRRDGGVVAVGISLVLFELASSCPEADTGSAGTAGCAG